MLKSDKPKLKKYYKQILKKIESKRIYLFDNGDMYSVYINIDGCNDLFITELEEICELAMIEAYGNFRIKKSDTAKLYIKLVSLDKIKAMKCEFLYKVLGINL